TTGAGKFSRIGSGSYLHDKMSGNRQTGVGRAPRAFDGAGRETARKCATGARMRKTNGWRWGRGTSVIAPAIVIGLSIVPTSAGPQTTDAPAAAELPPVSVIAPTPLAGTRTPKPTARPAATRRTGATRARTAPVEAAEAPAAGSAAAARNSNL